MERNASRSAAVPAAASESLDVRRRPHRDFLPAKTLDEFACSQRFGEIDGEILVLDSVSSPITKRVYNMALDEFFGWYAQEPRPGFTKATVSAWRVTLEERGESPVRSSC